MAKGMIGPMRMAKNIKGIEQVDPSAGCAYPGKATRLSGIEKANFQTGKKARRSAPSTGKTRTKPTAAKTRSKPGY
jgi:hypothetical protein